MRSAPTFCAAALVSAVLSSLSFAGGGGVVGNWKLSIAGRDPQSFWLIHLAMGKDGQITGSADALKGAPRAKVESVKVGGDTLSIKLHATVFSQGRPQMVVFDYEGKLPKPGAKKLYGSLAWEGLTMPALMESSSAKNLFEMDKEMLLRTPYDPRALAALLDLIDTAKDNKLAAADLQSLVDGSLKAASQYGPRMHTKHQLDTLDKLLKHKVYAEVAIETARKIARQVNATMPIDAQLQSLSRAAAALRQGGQAKEAAGLDARLDTLEDQAFASHGKDALNFKPEKFQGRKGKSTRAVLVELFTGAQCPPCVAADMAFDGLEKTYGPGEVVLLQYHLHIPGPDPMSNRDNDARFEYYAKTYPNKVRGMPTSIFAGKPDASGGGSREGAPEKYKEFCAAVNKNLEVAAEAQVSASAVRTGSKIAILAQVKNLTKPGDKMRLRLALVEDWVRYRGNNGLQYHHRIVRAMPGGVKGIALPKKELEHTVTVDLDELRAGLNKYLDEDYDGPRPMRLRNLSVVAFIQNDENADVLQAVNVAVKTK
ncbi:MAG: hypothetical protein HYX68_15215 [Planctomycetes bacterium]|nr:hypothetical protein [Planctomycetota bacterium]